MRRLISEKFAANKFSIFCFRVFSIITVILHAVLYGRVSLAFNLRNVWKMSSPRTATVPEDLNYSLFLTALNIYDIYRLK